MQVNGVEVPDEYAGSVELQQAYLSSMKSKPADPPPSDPPPPSPPPPSDPPPVDPPPPPPTPTADVIELTKYNELKLQHDEISKKYAEIEGKFSNIVEPDPETYRLSHIKKNNPELFPIYASLKLTGNMKPVDLLVEDYIAENPDYKDKRNQVVEFILNKYGLDAEVPEPLTLDVENGIYEADVNARKSEIDKANRQLRINEMRLETDYKAAQKKFVDKFDAIEIPFSKPKTQEEITAAKEQLKSTWKPVVDEVFKTVNAIPIFGTVKEGEQATPFIEIALTDEQKKAHTEGMLQYLSESGLQPTKESLEQAYARFHMKFVADNLNQIVSAVAVKARKMTEEEYDKMYANPSALKDQSNANPKPTNELEDSRAMALRAEGIRT